MHRNACTGEKGVVGEREWDGGRANNTIIELVHMKRAWMLPNTLDTPSVAGIIFRTCCPKVPSVAHYQVYFMVRVYLEYSHYE